MKSKDYGRTALNIANDVSETVYKVIIALAIMGLITIFSTIISVVALIVTLQ